MRFWLFNPIFIPFFVAGHALFAASPDAVDHSIEETFGQTGIPLISSAKISRGEILDHLQRLCAKEAEEVGGKLIWLVDKQPERDQELFIIQVGDIPLRVYLDRICKAFDLQVEYCGNTVAVGDRNDALTPVLSQTFAVLPEFWETIRKNNPRLNDGHMPSAQDTRAFLESLGIIFPPTTGIDDIDTGQHLTVRNTEERIQQIATFLKKTYMMPSRFDLGVHIVSREREKGADFSIPDDVSGMRDAALRDLIASEKLTYLKGGFLDVARRKSGEIKALFQIADNLTGQMAVTVKKAKVLPGCAAVELVLEAKISIDELGYEWIHANSLTLAAGSALSLDLPPIDLPGQAPEKWQMVISTAFSFVDGTGAPETVFAEVESDKTDRLKTLVLPRIDFEDVPLPEVATEVREMSRKSDPTGIGGTVNLLLPLKPRRPLDDARGWQSEFEFGFETDPARPEDSRKDPYEHPYLTNIAATDIPFVDVCRFVAECNNLDYHLDEYGAWFSHPDFPMQETVWHVFVVTGSFPPGSTRDIPEGWHDGSPESEHSPEAGFIQWCEALGLAIAPQRDSVKLVPLPSEHLLAVRTNLANIELLESFGLSRDWHPGYVIQVKTAIKAQLFTAQNMANLFPGIGGLEVEGCQKKLDDAVDSLAKATLFDFELLGREGTITTLSFSCRYHGKSLAVFLSRQAETDPKSSWLGTSDTSIQMSLGAGNGLSWVAQKFWVVEKNQFFRLGTMAALDGIDSDDPHILVRERNSILDTTGLVLFHACGRHCGEPETGKCPVEAVVSDTGHAEAKGCPHSQVRIFSIGTEGVLSCALFSDEPWLIQKALGVRDTKLWARGHERALDQLGEYCRSIADRQPLQYRFSIRQKETGGVVDYFFPCVDSSPAATECKLAMKDMRVFSFQVREIVRGRKIRVNTFSSGKHVAATVLDVGRQVQLPFLPFALEIELQNTISKSSGRPLEDLLAEHNRKLQQRTERLAAFCRGMPLEPVALFKLENNTLQEAVALLTKQAGENGGNIQFLPSFFPWPHAEKPQESFGDSFEDWEETSAPVEKAHTCENDEATGAALLLEKQGTDQSESDFVRLISIEHDRMTADLSGKSPAEILMEIRGLYRCRMEVVDGKGLCVMPVLDMPMELMAARQELVENWMSRNGYSFRPVRTKTERFPFQRILEIQERKQQKHDYVWLFHPGGEILAAGSWDFLDNLRTFQE